MTIYIFLLVQAYYTYWILNFVYLIIPHYMEPWWNNKAQTEIPAQHIYIIHFQLVSFCSFFLQKAILEKYNVPSWKLHAYIHYQPSYYHFHVHFTNIKLEAPGFGADRAHLLTDVIDNIEMMGDYYEKKTLTFVARETEDLCLKFKEYGYFNEETPDSLSKG